MKDELSLIVYEASRNCRVAPIIETEKLKNNKFRMALTSSYAQPEVRNEVSFYSNPSNLSLVIPSTPIPKDSRGLLRKAIDYVEEKISPKRKLEIQKKIEQSNKIEHKREIYLWASEILEDISQKYVKAVKSYDTMINLREHALKNFEFLREGIDENEKKILKLSSEVENVEREIADGVLRKSLEECVTNSEFVEKLLSEIEPVSQSEINFEIAYLSREIEFAEPFLREFKDDVQRVDSALDVIDKKLPDYQTAMVCLKKYKNKLVGITGFQLDWMEFDNAMEQLPEVISKIKKLSEDLDLDFNMQMNNGFSNLKEDYGSVSDSGRIIEEINKLGETPIDERVKRIRRDKLLEKE